MSGSVGALSTSKVANATDPELRGLWHACLARLEASMSQPTFATWMATTQLIALDGSLATVAVPNKLARDWITERYLSEIASALSAEACVPSPKVLITIDELLPWTHGGDVYEEPPTLFEVELVRPPRDDVIAPTGRGRIENNLSRKAIFSLQGRRDDGTGRETVTDVVGKVTRTYTLGQLGALEMDVCIWLMGQWSPLNQGEVSFRLRELARGLGVAWNGNFGIAAKQAIRRMKEMTITGKVYDAETRRYREHGFSLIESYVLDEHRNTMDAESTRGSGMMSVRLGSWIVKQLEAGQFADLEMAIYRSTALRAPKARRLYQFLECGEGDDDGRTMRVPVNEALGETLSTSDARRNASRFRSDLVAYGKAICKATKGVYESVDLRQSATGWELVVRRSPEWRRTREEGRRHFHTLYPRAV